MSAQSMAWSKSEASTPRTLTEDTFPRTNGIDADNEVQPIAIVGLGKVYSNKPMDGALKSLIHSL